MNQHNNDDAESKRTQDKIKAKIHRVTAANDLLIMFLFVFNCSTAADVSSFDYRLQVDINLFDFAKADCYRYFLAPFDNINFCMIFVSRSVLVTEYGHFVVAAVPAVSCYMEHFSESFGLLRYLLLWVQ